MQLHALRGIDIDRAHVDVEALGLGPLRQLDPGLVLHRPLHLGVRVRVADRHHLHAGAEVALLQIGHVKAGDLHLLGDGDHVDLVEGAELPALGLVLALVDAGIDAAALVQPCQRGADRHVGVALRHLLQGDRGELLHAVGEETQQLVQHR